MIIPILFRSPETCVGCGIRGEFEGKWAEGAAAVEEVLGTGEGFCCCGTGGCG